MSHFTKWMFRSRDTGRVVVGQPANIQMKIFSAVTLVGTLLPRSRVRTTVASVAVLALAAWGVDELVRGVNPFRRILGALSLLALAGLSRRRPPLTR